MSIICRLSLYHLSFHSFITIIIFYIFFMYRPSFIFLFFNYHSLFIIIYFHLSSLIFHYTIYSLSFINYLPLLYQFIIYRSSQIITYHSIVHIFVFHLTHITLQLSTIIYHFFIYNLKNHLSFFTYHILSFVI